jgi:hypothetical protein
MILFNSSVQKTALPQLFVVINAENFIFFKIFFQLVLVFKNKNDIFAALIKRKKR